jgi:P27 family predicted phage terminase small subunit
MPGPAPLPLRLKLLRGNRGHESRARLQRGLEIEKPPEPPEPPSFVTGIALDEWFRVSVGLHALGLLTEVDTMPLAAYCVAFQRWVEAEQALARIAERDPATNGLLIRGAQGNPRANPLVRIAGEAARDMVNFASQFGFGPAARARIAAGVAREPPHGKFDGLLA